MHVFTMNYNIPHSTETQRSGGGDAEAPTRLLHVSNNETSADGIRRGAFLFYIININKSIRVDG